MNQQEYDVIDGIFDRLKQAEHVQRDPETESFIRDKIGKQPYAPYIMAQTIFAQEQALVNLHERVQRLEEELRKAKSAATAGGFLTGLFGSSTRTDPSASSSQARTPPDPSNREIAGSTASAGQATIQNAPPVQSTVAAGSGFLASAMTTAAGVAGGMIAGNVLAGALGLGAHAASGRNDNSLSEPLNATESARNTDDEFDAGNDDDI